MILVTSAFGTQGSLLLPKLSAAGVKVRALRRSADATAPEFDGVEVMAGDAADPAVLREAMNGVDSIYHIGPSAHPDERAMGLALVDCAAEMEIGHVVYSSVLHPIVTDLIQHKLKRDVEERLVSSGLNFTILQPSDYIQTQLPPPVFETNEVLVAWSLERRQAVVDVDDVTEVAVKVLLEGEPHFGATYELSSENVTGEDLRQALSRVTGKPATASRFPEGQITDMLIHLWKREGDVSYEKRVIDAICKWYDEHDFLGNHNVLEMLLGRPPTGVEAYLRKIAPDDMKTLTKGE